VSAFQALLLRPVARPRPPLRAETDPRAGLSGGSRPDCGGRSGTPCGSQPPAQSVARLRSPVSSWATLLTLSDTVVVLRACADAKPAS